MAKSRLYFIGSALLVPEGMFYLYILRYSGERWRLTKLKNSIFWLCGPFIGLLLLPSVNVLNRIHPSIFKG